VKGTGHPLKRRRMMRKAIALMFLGCFVLIGLAGNGAADEKKGVTYEKDVKAIIAARCLSCHGSNAPTINEFEKDKEGFKKKMKGPRMDSYENLIIFVRGDEAGALMRRLDDGKKKADGKAGNMYVWLGKTEPDRAENLSIMKKWVGEWTLKRKKEMTEEERKAIKAPEK
jgi:mono/diheme cytochrome c family protein